MMSGTDSMGQSSAQFRALVQGFGRSTIRSTVFSRSKGGSSFRTQGVQQSQPRAQTPIFAMTSGEAQVNPNTVTGIMFVFDTLA